MTTTPSFILELPIAPTSAQAKKLRVKLETARHLYNAFLCEAQKRLHLLRQSPQYFAACALPKTAKKERVLAFARARDDFGFTEYSLHKFATTARTGWLAEHIDANTAQTLASRAFRAVNRLAFGYARKVRFKSKGRGLDSVEGKTNKQGLRFVLKGNEGTFHWGGLVVLALIDWDDPVISHGLSCRIKYVRLVRRAATSARANGADCTAHRYYVQLVLEGKPYQKPSNSAGDLTLGLDLGPSVRREVVYVIAPHGNVDGACCFTNSTLQWRSGKATNRKRSPLTMYPAVVRLSPQPRGEGGSASIRRIGARVNGRVSICKRLLNIVIEEQA